LDGPIYKLMAQDGNAQREITVDVRGSASTSRSRPGAGLERVLTKVLRNPVLEIKDVVDFGAGKFKNVPFILGEGKNVCAVEFDKASLDQITEENLSKSRKFGVRFRSMNPRQFMANPSKFDLALLANVISTMPLIDERREMLELLHTKLRDGKFLLWFAQKREKHYAERREKGKVCGDGVWLGDGRQAQTFYRYFSPEEMHRHMHSAGFVPFDKFSVETNHAFLYQRT